MIEPNLYDVSSTVGIGTTFYVDKFYHARLSSKTHVLVALLRSNTILLKTRMLGRRPSKESNGQACLCSAWHPLAVWCIFVFHPHLTSIIYVQLFGHRHASWIVKQVWSLSRIFGSSGVLGLFVPLIAVCWWSSIAIPPLLGEIIWTFATATILSCVCW